MKIIPKKLKMRKNSKKASNPIKKHKKAPIP
jgi:hypothetical protein